MILCIETATTSSSIALFESNQLIGFNEIHIQKSHSAYLTVVIDQLFENCGKDKSELQAVAVSIGPGSYTGLRIGLSTAKGLCYALDIPLLTVNTLDIMYEQVIQYYNNKDFKNTFFCPMIDARRMEVYTAIYDIHKKVVLEPRALIIGKDAFKSFPQESSFFIFGDGASKCVEILSTKRFKFIDNVYPSAKYMGIRSLGMFKEKLFSNLAYAEPFYMKEYQAGKSRKNKLLS